MATSEGHAPDGNGGSVSKSPLDELTEPQLRDELRRTVSREVFSYDDYKAELERRAIRRDAMLSRRYTMATIGISLVAIIVSAFAAVIAIFFR